MFVINPLKSVVHEWKLKNVKQCETTTPLNIACVIHNSITNALPYNENKEDKKCFMEKLNIQEEVLHSNPVSNICATSS